VISEVLTAASSNKHLNFMSQFVAARNIFKRLLDVATASLGLVLLGPVLVLLALLIRLKLGSPVLFCQQRPGLNGKPFTMIKFRTMTDARNADGTLRSDQERLTAFGSWLRASSLDELPELLNVLRGTMSIVGPRPLLMAYLPLYNERQRRRHEVRPGITGWAQINGRNAITWDEKFELDVWYVENQSLGLDAKIILLTFARVFARSGIKAAGEATMPAFTGSSTSHSDSGLG
jgi:sugar transferase EpsL